MLTEGTCDLCALCNFAENRSSGREGKRRKMVIFSEGTVVLEAGILCFSVGLWCAQTWQLQLWSLLCLCFGHDKQRGFL